MAARATDSVVATYDIQDAPAVALGNW